MSGRHAITAAEGAAWRYQLDSMINVLDQIDDHAAQIGDVVALRLIRCLYEARAVASEIEMRPHPVSYTVSTLSDRGVSLLKRR